MAHIMMSKLRYDVFDEGREEKRDPLIAGGRNGTDFPAAIRTTRTGRPRTSPAPAHTPRGSVCSRQFDLRPSACDPFVQRGATLPLGRPVIRMGYEAEIHAAGAVPGDFRALFEDVRF